MTSRDWALDLHDAGFQVVLVPLKGKNPQIPWKAYQKERIPRSVVEAWYAHGEHNLALITGALSGVVVVDGDSPEACAFIEATCEPTPMVVETSKGRHYYYAHPGVKVPNAVRVMDEPPIDLRGDGGLVIGPGSLHRSGCFYRLAPGSDITPPIQLPKYRMNWFPKVETAQETTWTRPMLRFPTPESKDAYTQAQRYVAAVPGAIQNHGGDNHTYVLACRLVRGFNLSDDEAFDLLSVWNEKCQPSWSAQDLRAKVTHARAYGTGEFGSMLARNPTIHSGLVSYGWLS